MDLSMLGFAGETEFDLRFRLFDIPVRVHPMFWLSSAWMIWDGENIPFTLLGVLCIFVSIMVHELGHAAMMRRYGYPSEIVLYFLGGYATATHLSPWRNIRMSAAGPLAGLALAAFVYLLLVTMVEDPLQFLRNSRSPLSQVVWVSLFVGVFVNFMNLLPCLPLDGGRIMESLVTLYGKHGRGNQELVLKISAIVAGAVALRCAYCLNSADATVIPLAAFSWLPDPHRIILRGLQPDPKFMMIFFGLLCAQNIIALNQLRQWR
jgi:stage IV sporulation protein FB